MSGTSLRSFIASARSTSWSRRGRGRSRKRAAPRSMRISRRSSARSRRCGTAASCSGATRCFQAIASAPAISRPTSPAFWPGATGAFRIPPCSTASAWARCAAPTAPSCSARWASTRRMPGAFIFPRARPISTTSAAARSIFPAASRASSRRRPGSCPADYRSDADWHCISTGTAVAMIRILHVDMPGEALRAQDRRQSRRRSDRPNCRQFISSAARKIFNSAMPRFVTAFLEKQFG